MIIIVVMLVLFVPIAGILAAIAIPNLLTAMQRSRQKRTMADMRTVATAVEAYAMEHRAYPQADSLDALRPQLEPKYIQKVPAVDGWSHPYRYALIENGYTLVSAGADGKFEASPGEYTKSPTTFFDCDIVFSNGEFLVYPEGVQRGGS